MFSSSFALLVICFYVIVLFAVAFWVERSPGLGKKIGGNPVIYTLSLCIYVTAWTYYGSVGKAASSGFLFITIYLGPTLAIMAWCFVLRKLVRIKNTYHITSIADFVSSRYNKSHALAAIATLVALIGNIPYLSLQIKAIFTTFRIVVAQADAPVRGIGLFEHMDLIILGILFLFTILLGVRHLDPTERHRGMTVALALESIVKLVAFLAIGIYVVYFLYHGFGDLFKQAADKLILTQFTSGITTERNSFLVWLTYMILSTSAILFLDRQFHVSVVENSDERHIHTAMWLFPLYMFLINIFVFPIAMGGLLEGKMLHQADTFVLSLPIMHGNHWLALLVFIGGFSAATGMIIVCSMTVSTMVTNHLILPVITEIKGLGFLRRYLLVCRWIVVALFLIAGYWFTVKVGVTFTLVNLGMIAFAAFAQFAPPILLGLFWPRANRRGAILGMSAGFIVWFYTLMLPAFVQGGWLPGSLLTEGPWGISFLMPERLFGASIFDSLTHGTFWSLFFNIALMFAGSVFLKQEDEEKIIARDFVDILNPRLAPAQTVSPGGMIDFLPKKNIVDGVFSQFMTTSESQVVLEECLSEAGIAGKSQVSIVELADLQSKVEKRLSGIIGAAAAHRTLKQAGLFDAAESDRLKQTYSEILAGLNLSPDELKEKADYYQEKEILLNEHAEQLEEKIRQLELNIAERKRAENELRFIQNELEHRVKQRTEALRASEARFSQVAVSSGDWIWEIDTEGRYIYSSPVVKDILGYEPDEVLGRFFFDFSTLEDKKGLLSDLKIMIASKVSVLSFANSNFHKNGHIIFLETSGTPVLDSKGELIGYRGVDRDITARREAEIALEESEQRLAGIIDFLPDATFVIDTEGKVIAWNKATEEMTGVLAKDMLGLGNYEHSLPFYGTRRPALADLVIQPVMDMEAKYSLIEKAKDTLLTETWLPNVNGKDIYVWAKATPLYDAQGNVVGAIENVRDITDRKKAEKDLENAYEQLKLAQDKLVQSAKMASLGTLAGGVAHEINNPLTGVLNNVQLIKMMMTQKDSFQLGEFEKLLDIIEESAKRCALITRSLLDFSHASKGELGKVSINDMVEKVFFFIEHEVNLGNITVKKELGFDLPLLKGDPQLLQQIVFDIVSNAKWAIEKKGERGTGVISIKTESDQGKKMVVLSISDNGIGIPKENLGRIFEPFFTTKDVGEGTGLGLSLVYNMVKQHNGLIEAQSTVGKGTTFIVSLPAAD
jgi:PAS domain S-box-containing protein